MERRSVRSVLITGCSDGGLGAALALAFHRQGSYHVFATARNVQKMAHLSALGIETLELDILSEESVSSCVEKVSAATGGSLDVLVNNAGAAYNIPIIDASIPELEKQFGLNVFGTIRVTQAFFPLLRNSTTQWTKMIVNNTSVAQVLAMPFLSPYTASKAALATFTQTLRLEMHPFDIKVVELCTGGVESKFFTNVRTNAAVGLPENSPYAPGKERAEKFMREGPPVKLTDSEVWARQVVKDLSKRGGKGTPKQIWRGVGAWSSWFAGHWIPLGWLDGTIKKFTGLDEVERRIREYTQSGKGKAMQGEEGEQEQEQPPSQQPEEETSQLPPPSQQ